MPRKQQPPHERANVSSERHAANCSQRARNSHENRRARDARHNARHDAARAVFDVSRRETKRGVGQAASPGRRACHTAASAVAAITTRDFSAPRGRGCGDKPRGTHVRAHTPPPTRQQRATSPEGEPPLSHERCAPSPSCRAAVVEIHPTAALEHHLHLL